MHWANDAADVRRIVIEIARQYHVTRVAKVKSMVSEELELNDALRDAGITALETDLGEYIVQLDGSRPSHMTNPALHMTAETGTLVLVTNEGNGRMCTTLPPVHVAIVGIEKVIPDWNSAAILLQLLARSATGQRITSYTTFLTGTRDTGPREFHLVLLDNGRTRILQDERARETLLCIRCGACANICPVFSQVGGHAYGWAYSAISG